jgi:undecaprenyl-diphosphatase
LILKAIILGIIEGLTEFLPVSSTGHLIIANNFFSFEGSFEAMFDIVIQFGAILAVVVFFRKQIFPSGVLQKGALRKDNAEVKRVVNLWKKIIIGFLPAAFIGVFIDEILEKYLFNTMSVSIALIVGALLMIIAEKRKNVLSVDKPELITYKQALIVGFFQCLAMWPGMSRSASTIVGGLFCGFNRTLAAEFSFFLGIPTIMGASVYKLMKTGLDFSFNEWMTILTGTVVSFIIALFVIRFFMDYLKRKGLMPFAVYRIILGAVILLTM